MRNLISKLIIFLFALSLCTGATIYDLFAQTEKQLGIINKMKQTDPDIKIRWDKKTGTPARLSGKLSERIDADAKEIALRFFKANEALFSMTDSEQELTVVDVKKDPRGKEHVKLQQIYKSLPVEGKQVSVHINKNKEVQQVSGSFVPKIVLDTTPTIQSSNAINSAITASKQDLNPKMELIQEPEARLIIYNYKDKTYLAWKTRLDSDEPLGQFVYYVDAHTGKVIHFYNDLKFVLNRDTHNGNNFNNLPGTLERSEGDGSTGDAPIDAAHDNAGAVYNYYLNNHGRDSFGDSGETIISTAHHRMNYNNAFWNGVQMVYGDGDGNTFSPLSESKDVVAHELTHAVTDRTSGLIYENESGALNESISDIFGVLVDPPDWMLGEDIFTPATPGDALRYMDDPTLGNQPDHMDDFVTADSSGSSMDQACFNSNDRFNGCVHFNSGIPNKAAYLMSEGGTHRGITVQGMGRENMGKVFYETNIFYLNQSSGFIDAREASLDAVAAIFPGDASKKCTVQNAWAAVGIGDPCEDMIDGERLVFQYAVKFVCGKSSQDILASGKYFTAINVHNPNKETVGFRKKVTIALPSEEPGPISKSYDVWLKPDQSMEIDCPDIKRLVQSNEDFLKGFVVIDSKLELDVVAVYTAAGKSDTVETLHTRRVPVRRIE